MHIRLALFLAACNVAITASAMAQSVHEISERVDAHYNHLTSLKERFEETYQGAGTSRSESGVLWLRRPGKMRWEYEQPRQKLFVSDGKNVWFYVPGEADARRASIKKLDDLRSPLRYLLGKTKLEKEFRGISVSTSETGQVTITGVPKAMGGQVRAVDLVINSANQIEDIRIHETDGSTTEFQFSDIVENVAAPEALFQFSPPPGVSITSSEELAP